MAIDRRQLIAGLAASAAVAGLPAGRVRAGVLPTFVTTARDRLTGQFIAVGLKEDLDIIWETPLPDRGHGPIIDLARGVCIVVARRPGTFAVVLDLRTGHAITTISALKSRHFYGHGTFNGDGRYLFLTENDYEAGKGVLGVYDASDGFRRVNEVSTDGIGPHEVILMPDKRMLCVANGGIRTHPDKPREKLNIDTMRSTLQMIDAASGRLGTTYELRHDRLRKLSLRHIAATPDGRVIVGAQDEGRNGADRPIVFIATELELNPLQVSKDIQSRLKGYIGSVAADRNSGRLAASAPRGGLILEWDSSHDFHKATALKDGCGITFRHGAITATSGEGELIHRNMGKRHSFIHWDNHLSSS